MKYFTSDTHFQENRIGLNGKPNLFYRPFSSIKEQDETILQNFSNSSFKNGQDELWYLGDVIYDLNEDSISCLKKLRDRYNKSKFNLIIGNYDEKHLDVLSNYFDNMYNDFELNIGDKKYYLNHYPIKCKEKIGDHEFSITGHIHGLWKVQKKMVNVGVDAWHFKPVSETEIIFITNACEKYYDNNVFPY
jgi:calcineurin-like phosphoesterase family protein